MPTVAEARAELMAKTPQSQTIAGDRSEILNSGSANNSLALQNNTTQQIFTEPNSRGFV